MHILSSIIKMVVPTPFNVGPVNIYLIKGDALTLIDTGPRHMETWKIVQMEFKKLHLQIRDIDQIILTHHHTDHVGLVEEILDQKVVPVYSHPKAAPYLERDHEYMQMREEYFTILYRLHGVPLQLLAKLKEVETYLRQFEAPVKVNHFLQEGDRLPGHDGWEIIETPGHSPDHISLYRHSTSEMIGGDHIIKHISSNAFVEPGYGSIERPRALVVYQQALEKLLKYTISVVYAGHGEEVYDVHSLIKKRVKKQAERADHIYSLINTEISSFELSQNLFPHLYLKELPLTMSEVIGHIDLLVEQGRLTIEREEERFIFRHL